MVLYRKLKNVDLLWEKNHDTVPKTMVPNLKLWNFNQLWQKVW